MSEKNLVCGGDHTDHDLSALTAEHLLTELTSQKVADLFKALADPTRVQIVGLLAHAQMCVGDICLALNKAQPAISHQLRILRQSNLVKVQRDGQHIFYTLADEHIHTLFHQGLDHIQE